MQLFTNEISSFLVWSTVKKRLWANTILVKSVKILVFVLTRMEIKKGRLAMDLYHAVQRGSGSITAYGIFFHF